MAAQLRVFARGLAAAGMRDRAAAVYCGLLQARFEALSLCIRHDTERAIGLRKAALNMLFTWASLCCCFESCSCSHDRRSGRC